jgi:hypothetical protein
MRASTCGADNIKLIFLITYQGFDHITELHECRCPKEVHAIAIRQHLEGVGDGLISMVYYHSSTEQAMLGDYMLECALKGTVKKAHAKEDGSIICGGKVAGCGVSIEHYRSDELQNWFEDVNLASNVKTIKTSSHYVFFG